MFLIQSTTGIFVTVPLTLTAIEFKRFLQVSLAFICIVSFFCQYTVVLEVVMLFFMSTERFLAINFPFQHRLYVKTTKILVVVVFIFLFSSIPGFAYSTYIVPLYFKSQKSPCYIYFITVGSISFALIVIIYILLIISYATIRKSINTKIKQQEERTSTPNEENVNIILLERKHLRIFRILLAMCTIYMVTFAPSAVFYICFAFVTEDTLNLHIIDYSFLLLYYLSSIINPLITLCFKEDYRKTFCNWFKRNALAPAQQNERLPQQQQQHTQDIGTTAL